MKNFKFNLISILFTIIIGLCPVFFIDQIAATSLSREIIISTISVMAAVNTPYRNIASKCTLVAFSSLQISQCTVLSIYYFTNLQDPIWSIVVSVSMMSVSAVFVVIEMTKRYKFIQDDLDDAHIFYLTPKVDDFTGLLSSLFYLPFGGVKVYCNGHVYAYRHGILRKFSGRSADFYLNRCLIFNTNVIYSNSIERDLDYLVGTKWSFTHNCYTTFEPMFGKLSLLLKGKTNERNVPRRYQKTNRTRNES